MKRTALIALTALGALSAAPAAAQDTVIVIRPDVPAYGTPAGRRAVDVFNATLTRRVFGSDTVAAGETVRGDIAVYGGALRIDGTVLGEVVAINADLSIAAGAEIRGDIMVFGGTLSESLDARLLGTLEHHASRLAVRRVGDRLELFETERRVEPRRRIGRLPRSHYARASIVVSTAGTYNRVEGLPVYLGPGLRWTTRAAELRLEGLGIFRTAAGFDVDSRELGYLARGRLRLGYERIVELSGAAYDVVAPIEDWTLHDDEIGLASFLMQRDYRDYFLERGVAGELRVRPTSELSVFGGIARIDATSVAARDPWTLFRNSDTWRPNPAIDEGDFTEFTAGLELDTRHGWRWGPALLIRAEWERGIGGNVSPVALPLAVRDPVPANDWTWDRGMVDARLYQPAGFGGLSLRAVGEGTLGGDPLPLQRRLSLGGPDPLPGYTFRRFACNEALSDPALPALCDRMLLFQAEYRGWFDFDLFDWDHHSDRRDRHDRRRDRRDWDWDWDWWDWDWDGPEFVFFGNAGTAWIADRDDGPGPLRWDVGAGLEFGGAGVYLARAIAADEPVRVIFRLHRRF